MFVTQVTELLNLDYTYKIDFDIDPSDNSNTYYAFLDVDKDGIDDLKLGIIDGLATSVSSVNTVDDPSWDGISPTSKFNLLHLRHNVWNINYSNPTIDSYYEDNEQHQNRGHGEYTTDNEWL